MKRIVISMAILVTLCALLLAACGEQAATTTQPPGGEVTATEAAASGSAGTAAPTTGIPATEATAEEKPLIGVCLPSLDNPLMLELEQTMRSFSDRFRVEVSSADGNPNTQASQIENYTAMKAKMLFVMAVEATSLLPKLEAARNAGVFVMVVGGEPGESGRDVVMKMDQFLAGEYCALMAKEWVDKTYPAAPERSLETAVFISSLTTEAVQRSNGLLMISEPYLKDWQGAYIDATGAPLSDKEGKYVAGKGEADRVPNPCYCPAVTIVETPTAEMFQAGQTAMQNVLTTQPGVKLVLAYASDGGCGASQAIMDEYAKGSNSAIKDLSKVAVFGVGMIGPEADAIKASAQGKGVFRGAIAFGGGDLPGKTKEIVSKILNGEDYPTVIWDELAIVTPGADGELQYRPMPNQGVLTVGP
ncbi:MAG: substrate-binding domain-containing protein [Actinomycetia bacterium]|nr:substrate-binding domain-containing protein [Actinomycetes bacterium]